MSLGFFVEYFPEKAKLLTSIGVTFVIQ